MQGGNDKSLVLKESAIGLIKGAIGAIPFCGGAINEALFDILGRIQQKRINEFVLQLSSLINEIQDNKIDQEYLKSENFYDLTKLIFESVIKTKSKEKQIALSKIYLNAILDKSDIEDDFSILFSKFVLDLIPLQMRIMFFVEKNEDNLIEIGTYEKFYDLFIDSFKYNDLDKYEFKYSCNDLENKALISLGAGLDNFDSTSSLFATSSHKVASVKLTNLGKEFITYL